MSKGQKSFDELFAIAKSKGLSDMDAINAVTDKQFQDLMLEYYTEDADFEIIEAKQLPNEKSPC